MHPNPFPLKRFSSSYIKRILNELDQQLCLANPCYVSQNMDCEGRVLPIKYINICDPTDPLNNLGTSVRFENAIAIQAFFKTLVHEMDIITKEATCEKAFVLGLNKIFGNTEHFKDHDESPSKNT